MVGSEWSSELWSRVTVPLLHHYIGSYPHRDWDAFYGDSLLSALHRVLLTPNAFSLTTLLVFTERCSFTVDRFLVAALSKSEQFIVMRSVVRRVCGAAAWAQAQSRAQRRAFSATARRLDTYAFIGLGQMVCDVLSVGRWGSGFLRREMSDSSGACLHLGISNGAEPTVQADAQRHCLAI